MLSTRRKRRKTGRGRSRSEAENRGEWGLWTKIKPRNEKLYTAEGMSGAKRGRKGSGVVEVKYEVRIGM